jgi:hypothetical protein
LRQLRHKDVVLVVIYTSVEFEEDARHNLRRPFKLHLSDIEYAEVELSACHQLVLCL